MPRRSRSRSSSPRRSRSRRSRSGSRARSPRQSRSRSGSRDRHVSPSDVGYRIHIGDLVPDTSERELKKSFEKYGSLLEVWFARRPPCYAFIVFKEKEDAEEAVRETDGKYVCGVRVRVSHAKPRVRGGRRNMFGYGSDSPPRHNDRGSSQRCFTCGETGHFARDCYKIGRDRDRNNSRSRSRSPRRERKDRDRSRDRSRDRRRRSPSPAEERVARRSADRGKQRETSRRGRSRSNDRQPAHNNDGLAAHDGNGNGEEAFE